MDLTLDRWERMNVSEREATARRLAGELPAGFAFRAIRSFSLGDRRHDMAMYDFDGARFALIPGGIVRLGHDTNRHREPSPEELESWRGTAEQHDIHQSIDDYISSVTLRPRDVEIRPFLMESAAGEVGWESIPPDDPEVVEVLRELTSSLKRMGRDLGREAQVSSGGRITRVRKGEDGSLTAQRALTMTHEDVAGRLGTAGFRLPTSDEWEYACGCGGDTLFRWGDHVPCDHYPIHASAEEAAWKRQQARSRGKLEYPKEGFASDWDHHRRPNAFGLSFSSDTYRWELVFEPGLSRGGDGGEKLCGGAGFFAGWLTLATAYFEEHSCKHDPTRPIDPEFAVVRRTLPL